MFFCFFFFNDTATTEIYTLSLHDALPISAARCAEDACRMRVIHGEHRIILPCQGGKIRQLRDVTFQDRKSTRLNSSHSQISYAVFCLKKKKNKTLCSSHYTF